jgi:hypothetical protein
MHQQLWGYKVEEKLYLGVREQKRLNTTALAPSWLAVGTSQYQQWPSHNGVHAGFSTDPSAIIKYVILQEYAKPSGKINSFIEVVCRYIYGNLFNNEALDNVNKLWLIRINVICL